MNSPAYYDVHHRFKWNGLPLHKADLCRNAIRFIEEGADFEKDTGIFLLDWFDEKPFVELTTSGTTGTPKVIRILKQAMVNSALATGDFFDLKPGDKALHCLSTKYIAGKMMLVRGLILGLEMDFTAPTSIPLQDNLTAYDFVALVPLQVQNTLSELHRVKKIIIGGAQINECLKIELLQLPNQVFETYGMTETITHIAAKRIGEKFFSVMPDVKIAQDERGCLVIDAPRISDEKVATNDLVELFSETQFVLLGRIDNVINSGGIKLIPEQIEEKLSGKIAGRFFVTGIPDETLGEKLILVLESKKHRFDEKAFECLTKFEKPKKIIFVPKFKETESGKVMRKESIKGLL